MSQAKGRFTALHLILLALLCYARFTSGQRMHGAYPTASFSLPGLVNGSPALSASFFSDDDGEERIEEGEVEEASPNRVLETSEAPVGRFPYVCSVRSASESAEHVCTGVLVGSQWVLTAAHCLNSAVTNLASEESSVYCGVQDFALANADHIHTIVETHSSAEEGYTSESHDVVLLKLDRARNLEAPKFDETLGMSEIGVGWDFAGTPGTSSKLQVIQGLRRDRRTRCCSLVDQSRDVSEVICTRFTSEDEIACRTERASGFLLVAVPSVDTLERGNGDSDVILGVGSLIRICPENRKCVLYTAVNPLKQWIQDTIAGETEEELMVSTETEPSLPTGTEPSGVSDDDPLEDEETTQQLKEIIDAIFRNYRFGTRTVLEDGLDPNSRVSNSTIEKGDVDATLLHLAVWINSDESVKVLIDNGADVNTVDIEGKTPLHYAAEKGYLALVELLIENGADIDATDGVGETPLIDATFEGHLEIVRFLIEKGADVNVSDNDKDTALHEACFRGHLAIALALISSDADVNAVDDEGETPLHEAAEYGYAEIVEALVLGGASVDTEDDKGNTPADVICVRANPPCSTTTYTAISNRLSP